MEFLGQYHTQIVHFPIALVLVSLLFDVVGRATDSAWWRKASLALLVFAVVGGAAAVLSGEPASEVAENKQGIPEATVEKHEDMGKIAAWLAGGALAARLVENGVGSARVLVGALALLLQLGAAVTIGIAGHRGGMLVQKHGAGVAIEGQLIRAPGAPPKAIETKEHDK
jgi:uncharacterized membrane protein